MDVGEVVDAAGQFGEFCSRHVGRVFARGGCSGGLGEGRKGIGDEGAQAVDGADEAFVAQDPHCGAGGHVGDPVVLLQDARRRHLVAGRQSPCVYLLAQYIGQKPVGRPV